MNALLVSTYILVTANTMFSLTRKENTCRHNVSVSQKENEGSVSMKDLETNNIP
jgi:hypothetical protein